MGAGFDRLSQRPFAEPVEANRELTPPTTGATPEC